MDISRAFREATAHPSSAFRVRLFAFCCVVILLMCGLMGGCSRSSSTDTSGPSSTDRDVVYAAYVPAAYFLPLLVVERDALLEKRGYSIQIKSYESNTEMVSLFLNGHLDVAAQSAFTMFPVENEHPGMFKFIYGQYCKSYAFVVPTTSTIKSLGDLKNKTIGIWQSPTAEAYVKLLLQKRGLIYTRDEQQFTLKPYPASSLAAQLQNKTVDAMFGFDLPNASLVSTGKFRYLEPDAVASLIEGAKAPFNGGGFVSTRLIASNPKKAKAIKEALFEALETIRTKPEHVTAILSAKLKFTDNIARTARLDEFTWPNGELILAGEKTAAALQQAGVLLQAVDVRGMFWLSPQ